MKVRNENMKNLILKIRHWLIKKLGGYTEQHVENRRITAYPSYQIKPVILRTEMRISHYMMFSDMTEQERYDYFKQRLIQQIAEKIVEDDLTLVSCTDDVPRGERMYRAELYLIHPHDVVFCTNPLTHF